MGTSKIALSGERAVTETIRLHWLLFLAQGIAMMVLGGLAVIWPQISTLAIDFYVGWMFLISGLIGLFAMFVASSAAAFLWSLLTAALSLFVGILLLWHPVEGAVSLTLVLISFFMAEGIFQIAAAIRYREAFPDSWGWLLISGLADLALAAMLIWGWPSAATWALGLIAGVSLITSGLAIVMVAAAARNMVRIVEQATR